ncbi:hypothetical protein J6590_027874 [Homalodisca vitripennis]|nr:hypothetical protein J6590_027874 [Homalodisca vitripennis]
MNHSFELQNLVQGEKMPLDGKIKALELDLRKRDEVVSSLTASKLKTVKYSCHGLEENNTGLSNSVKTLILKLNLVNNEIIILRSKPKQSNINYK